MWTLFPSFKTVARYPLSTVLLVLSTHHHAFSPPLSDPSFTPLSHIPHPHTSSLFHHFAAYKNCYTDYLYDGISTALLSLTPFLFSPDFFLRDIGWRAVRDPEEIGTFAEH